MVVLSKPIPTKVEIELEKLKLIAEYYEFPLTVFFMPLEELKKIVEEEKRTRSKDCQEAFEKLKKIREILEEVDAK